MVDGKRGELGRRSEEVVVLSVRNDQTPDPGALCSTVTSSTPVRSDTVKKRRDPERMGREETEGRQDPGLDPLPPSLKVREVTGLGSRTGTER